MVTKRHGGAGIFTGASRTPRKRQAPTGPQSSLTALGGVAYCWDIATDTLTWGPNAAHLFGPSSHALPRTGHALSQMVEPGSGLDRRAALKPEDGPRYDTRYALRFGPDHVAMVQDAGRFQADAEGRPAFVRGLLRIDPKASAKELLPATIRARSALLERVQDEINEALRFSHTCTLIVGSFDEDAPESREDIARAVRPLMRRRDHVAILTSNRFALMLTSCPLAEAESAMKRLAGLLGAYPNLRLGAACGPEQTFEATALLRAAEQALDTAQSGADAAFLHDARKNPRTPSPASKRAPYDLIAALNDRRLVLASRPMVDAHSRHPALLQTCAAIAGPDGDVIPLNAIPALAEANLAALIDGRMLELAADHLVRHPGERLVLPIADATLHDAEWLTMLAAHLGARPGIASRLLIEVPEVALLDAAAARGRLDAMKALGIGIALGGFGTGHATCTHLQVLPIDLLKIDGVFIQSLRRSTDDRLFVSTLVDLAHHLGIATAAEWVDDEDTARLLQSLGVDYLQGAAFGEVEPIVSPQPAWRRVTANSGS
ncbi:EAL domain-containing protein [Microvirga alba]|uniref:EAL domain-containing protein n=1 Tax=Microvirga alba TaxID=2791025 RepID=A0A931BTW0_9HYPH|nr:GGDEF domain-containing phosphodiesterase [Microvirga alba]MBF9232727.1 EAL domain-containing protein [Microvirga alba]